MFLLLQGYNKININDLKLFVQNMTYLFPTYLDFMASSVLVSSFVIVHHRCVIFVSCMDCRNPSEIKHKAIFALEVVDGLPSKHMRFLLGCGAHN